MKNLILLTNKFPYEGGEQFIETEIEFWKKNSFDNVYIMPHSASDTLRKMPLNIILMKPNDKNYNFIYGLLTLVNPIFYKEFYYIFREFGVRGFISNSSEAFKTTALSLKAKKNLSYFLKSKIKDNITIYSYWNDSSFYAACLLKREGLVDKVISRAHRFDIYEEERSKNYMPLKRQFVNDFDKVFLLSESAFSYYEQTYNVDPRFLDISRLGVVMPLNKPTNGYDKNTLSILSLSYCHVGKQIHKIIDAVYEYAKRNLQVKIEWTHIGNGELFKQLKEQSENLSSIQENLRIKFLGELKNSDVKNHLELNYYNVFINASKSEGVPVSIMEAMSYGIPAIAPDVGGVSDLVNMSNGYLMPSEVSSEEIIRGIDKIRARNTYRENAFNWISKNFNSSLNYPEFIQKVEIIAGINDCK